MSKTAIVLFNLGGPDKPESVKPFLFNLFNDKAIIGVPQPMRYMIAKLISGKREEEAKHIYAQIGGKSPIVEQTQAQANALEGMLGEDKYKVFVAMRYWHPRADEAAKAVKEYNPDQIILLPLYPQFSTTTTGSSVTEWHQAAKRAKLNAPTHTVCCYPTQPEFIEAHVALIKTAYAEAKNFGTPRILFSAHGLPEKIINAGDPYQAQIEATTQEIIKTLEHAAAGTGLVNPASLERRGHDVVDYAICYQSKVGPLEWIKPSTESEILRAGSDGVPIVVVPIAFVSEHSETLVELDIQYKELAAQHNVPGYVRVPALQTQEAFLRGLASVCFHAGNRGTRSGDGYRCRETCGKCPAREVA